MDMKQYKYIHALIQVHNIFLEISVLEYTDPQHMDMKQYKYKILLYRYMIYSWRYLY